MPSIAALHPSERAQARAAARPKEWRLWRQAALIAAPIVAVVTALCVFIAGDASRAEPVRRLAAAVAAPAAEPAVPAAFARAAPFAAPAQGTTGTIALPPEPSFVPAALGDATVTPARPFSTIGSSATDRGRALDCLTDRDLLRGRLRARRRAARGRAGDPQPRPPPRLPEHRLRRRLSGRRSARAAASSASPATARWRGGRRAAAGPRGAHRGGGARRPCLRAGRARDALPHLCRHPGVEPHPGDDRCDRRAFLPPLEGLLGHRAAFSQRYRGGEPVPGPHAKPCAGRRCARPSRPSCSPPPLAPLRTCHRADDVQPAHPDSGIALAASTRLADPRSLEGFGKADPLIGTRRPPSGRFDPRRRSDGARLKE